MKAYWDASALVETHLDQELHDRLKNEGAITRTHSLTEIFSTLTGGRFLLRVSPDQAASSIEKLVEYLEFVDLTGKEIVEALKKARQMGVRGGRVHDYIHAIAAEKSGAKKLLTLDKNDFTGLSAHLAIEQV
ncbi:MAG TPA: PIN domain-containing protein [Verrucomicrobiae bacterium]|nr:PIN domain-containing protein [Verrucomicrobiae bacterium]